MAVARAALADLTLDDKYAREEGQIFLSGTQALVRLTLEQRRRDVRAGLNTAGYISGYRGSPMGTFDSELNRAHTLLDEHHIHFRPGVNEDLAATSVWGTQQVASQPTALYDGVFSLWYGKGPGVDRSGDALKHGNMAGTSKHGGVLVAFGDDHGAKSSTVAHQSEYALVAAFIPILNPSNVQDILDFGLAGWAMSRFAGLWVGLKGVNETLLSAATISVHPSRRPGLRPRQ
jgi:indolepyruvate ferredoxin oxidoreductase